MGINAEGCLEAATSEPTGPAATSNEESASRPGNSNFTPCVKAKPLARPAFDRVAWVDYAKGICIILVVMLHVVGSYESKVGAEGWLRPIVEFARSFRIPEFFMISGLFLRRSLFGPTKNYLDRKFVHFAYFYLIWLTIQHTFRHADLVVSSPGLFAFQWLKALAIPSGTLWFIHMLAIFYLTTWALRHARKELVLVAAIILQFAYQWGTIETGWKVADRFFHYYVYFFIGYAAADLVFSLVRKLSARRGLAFLGLAAWGGINWAMINAGLYTKPGISLGMGLAGAAAISTFSNLICAHRFAQPLGYIGRHSIVIYLTFFLPMKALEIAFLQGGTAIVSVGWATTVILLGALLGPLLWYRLIRHTPLVWLYKRPALFLLPGSQPPGRLKAALPGSRAS